MGERSTLSLMEIILTPCLHPSAYHRDRCSALHCSLYLPTIYRHVWNHAPFTYSLTTLRSTALNERQIKAVSQLEKALDELYDWRILNRLNPHPEKSEARLFCKTSAMGPLAPIHIGTDAIEWANKSRLLGTTVDDKLT